MKKDYSVPKVYYKLPSDFESFSEKNKDQIIDNIYEEMIGRDKTKFRVLKSKTKIEISKRIFKYLTNSKCKSK
jgi:hypothetical protein